MVFRANMTLKLDYHGKRVLKSMRTATKETIRESAGVVAERAKKKVRVKTGILRDSIEGKARKARGEDRFLGVVSTNTAGVYVKAGIIYDRKGRAYGETPEYINSKGKKRRVMNRKPNKFRYGGKIEKDFPYLRPALTESIDDIHRIMKQQAGRQAASK